MDCARALSCSLRSEVNCRVIKAASFQSHAAYVELVASVAQPPKWFCSHWWGEPVLDFVNVLHRHCADRMQDLRTTYYWICAYANNQWKLNEEVTVDPSQSSFRRALNESIGTLVIVDTKSTNFTRIWCDYEISVSLESGRTVCDEWLGPTPHTYAIHPRHTPTPNVLCSPALSLLY